MEYSVMPIVYFLWATFFLATHISLTLIVYKDAKNLRYPALGISPFLWAGVSFSLPILGMFIYWLMNHSILCRSFKWPSSFERYDNNE